MAERKKLMILLPDGVGLRNFAYSDFPKLAEDAGFDLIFWNSTPFDLSSLGLNEIKIDKPEPHPLTDLLKRARTQIDLNRNIRTSGDDIYKSYRFSSSSKNIKDLIKNAIVKWFLFRYDSEMGNASLRKRIKKQERKSAHYRYCLELLKKEKPDFLFCTNQRPLTAIAPVLAAQDLGIPSGTFIFSWDNLPKGTMVIEPDHYFVWSEHMKNELRQYYPYISDEQIFVTGTPQFEPHGNCGMVMPKQEFFSKFNLDPEKKYICYSGDDITTSPNDPQYLEDTAKAIRSLNTKGFRLGLLFRRCPVDFSERFDAVLTNYADVIVAVDPVWVKLSDSWNAILPTKEDLVLQLSTIAHTEAVINLGSSMVFDYVMFEKPCAYINYDVPAGIRPGWSVEKVYRFIHFRSMPDRSAVIWIDNPGDLSAKIEEMLVGKPTVEHAKEWFSKINVQPSGHASARILASIKKITG